MVEWDCGFTSSSPEYQQMVLNEDFEQFRSEKILKNDKVHVHVWTALLLNIYVRAPTS